MIDGALVGSMWTGGLGILTLCIAKIKCYYTRDTDGNCSPVCACMDSKLRESHEDIEIREIDLGGDAHGVLLLPRK